MSKTHRRHESRAKRAKRGPKNKVSDEDVKPLMKSNKQRRVNERRALRREWA